MFEVGYALGALEPGRVILVFNETSGRIEDLPFDLRPRMTMKYRAEKGESGVENLDRTNARRGLARQLAGAIKAILDKQKDDIETPPPEPSSSPFDVAFAGVSSNAPDVRARMLDYMRWVAKNIEGRIPTDDTQRSDDALVREVDDATSIVGDFARLAELIARNGAESAAVAIAAGFEMILQLYDQHPRKEGSIRDTDFDLAKILGHELFVVLAAALIRHQQFETLHRVLAADLCIETRSGKDTRSWVALSKLSMLLQMRKQRLGSNAYSLHAERLMLRRKDVDVAAVSPFKEFMEADFFLYLASALHPNAKPFDRAGATWRPWSLVYTDWIDFDFLARSKSRAFAQKLLAPLRLDTVEQLRERYRERALAFAKMFDSFGMSIEGGIEAKEIASKP